MTRAWRQRQAGFGHIEIGMAVAGIVALAALAWAVKGYLNDVEQRGYERGAAAVQIKWDEANRKAEEQARAQRIAVAAALAEEEKRRLAAEEAARVATANWEQERRDARRKGTRLAVCESAGEVRGAAEAASGAAAAAASPRVMLTWGFVRLYDAAWTGIDGKPVFRAAAGADAAEPADSAAPVGIDDALDVHGTNAARCSADRRAYAELWRRVEAAGIAWDGASR